MSDKNVALSSDPKAIAADIVRELRENPLAWCQGNYAQDKEGHGCSLQDEIACSWCIMGHVRKRTGFENADAHQRFRDYFENVVGTYPAPFNDNEDRNVFDIIAICEKVANG